MEPIWMLVTIGLVGTTVFLFMQLKKIQRYQSDLESELRLYVDAMDAKNTELLATVESLLVTRHSRKRHSNGQKDREESNPLLEKQEEIEQVLSTEPVEPTDDIMDEIYVLDQQGLTAVEIAERLGRPQSEINLLIFLARKERQ